MGMKTPLLSWVLLVGLPWTSTSCGAIRNKGPTLGPSAAFHLPPSLWSPPPPKVPSSHLSGRGNGWQQPRTSRLASSQTSVDQEDFPGSTLVLQNKDLGSTVYLVGCFHGSRQSEQDVSLIFDKVDPSVVVLELCPERYNRMVVEMEARKNRAGKSMPYLHQRVGRLGQAIREFYSKYGLVQTLVTALLSSPTEMQRLMENGEPGCEFKKGISLAQERKAKLVLGDQDVDMTLARLKEGVMRSDWVLENPKEELQNLAEAVLGPAGLAPSKKVNLFRVLFTRKMMVKETLQTIGPVSLLLFVIADSLDKAVDSTWTSLTALSNDAVVDPAVSSMATMAMETLESVGWLATNAFLALIFLAVNRFILAERDSYLAESIHQSCLTNPDSRVIAVVGLLHCNGIARHLRTRGYE